MVCAVCGKPVQAVRHEIQLGVQPLSRRKGERLAPLKIVIAPLYYVAQPGGIEMQKPLCSAACRVPR